MTTGKRPSGWNFLASPISRVIGGVVTLILLLVAVSRAQSGFVINTSAFKPGGQIPAEYSCSGANRSPALQWSGAPAGSGSFALIVEDPDAPSGTFIHWVVFNLPADATGIAADAPKTPKLADGAMQGTNGADQIGYMGPCPPPGKVHHYHFELFALDSKLDSQPGIDASALHTAMQGHIKANTEIVGTFER
jgi:Raf kinase inhibitor-like YbhB/YbcL family protein